VIEVVFERLPVDLGIHHEGSSSGELTLDSILLLLEDVNWNCTRIVAFISARRSLSSWTIRRRWRAASFFACSLRLAAAAMMCREPSGTRRSPALLATIGLDLSDEEC
jgi:hypothetical protein